jgi:hypothetical protein
MGNTRDNCKTFGKATSAECGQVTEQATGEKSTPSTEPPRPDESRFELVSSPSVPRISLDKGLPTILWYYRRDALSDLREHEVLLMPKSEKSDRLGCD